MVLHPVNASGPGIQVTAHLAAYPRVSEPALTSFTVASTIRVKSIRPLGPVFQGACVGQSQGVVRSFPPASNRRRGERCRSLGYLRFSC